MVFLILFFNLPDLAAGGVFDRVVAKVNSEIITLSSVQDRVEVLKAKYANDLGSYDEKKLLMEAVEMIIVEKLQLQQGKKMGFEVEDSAVEAALRNIEKNNGLEEGQLATMLESEGRSLESYKNHIRDQILVSKVTQFELGSRLMVSDRKIAKYYRDNQKDFWEEGKFKVRHILIISEKDATAGNKMESYKQIKNILSEIKNGKDFAEAAKEYSEDVSASSGGLIGYIKKGTGVPEFEEAVFSLKEGKISDVVETEFGFHIIKVDKIQPGRTLPFNEVKGKIHNKLNFENKKSAYEGWMRELRETAFIEISLFDQPKKIIKPDMVGLNKPKKMGRDNSRRNGLSQSNKDNLKKQKTKEQMEKKWVEMYKSVEKAKNRTTGQSISSFQTLEEKLLAIKELRSRKKITEAEYQKRKKQLLESTGQSISSFQTLEEKLLAIKELRSRKKITEAEYQKRKQRLLGDL